MRAVAEQAPWPIHHADVVAASERIRRYLPATPLRCYPSLDAAVGGRIQVLVKHENHQPTNAFKVRNALSAMTCLDQDQRRTGVIAATTGNYGQGLAYGGRLLGIPVTVCAPRGSNDDKIVAVKGLGAELVEEGEDFDDALDVANRLAQQRRLTLIHSTNDPLVIAGAGTITLEILEQTPELDAMVLTIGSGSHAVGALTVLRNLRPEVQVYAVQAEGAAAAYHSWRAGRPLPAISPDTFADGIATRGTYTATFPALRAGLAGFVTVTDGQIAAALRLLLRTTHNLVEGAGAAGLAGLMVLRDALAGKRVAIVLTGGNIDEATLARLLGAHLPQTELLEVHPHGTEDS